MPISAEEGDIRTLADKIPGQQDVEADILYGQLQEQLGKLLDLLDPLEATALRLRYGVADGDTFTSAVL